MGPTPVRDPNPFRTRISSVPVLKFRFVADSDNEKRGGEILTNVFSSIQLQFLSRFLTVRVPVPFTLPWLVEHTQKTMRELLIFI